MSDNNSTFKSGTYRTQRHTDVTHEVCRWNSYLYRQSTMAHKPLVNSVKSVEDAFISTMDPSLDEYLECNRLRTLADCLGREVYSKLYDAASTVELENHAAGSEKVSQAHEVMSGLQEFQSLADSVHGDPDIAAIASSKLLDGIAKAFKDEAKEKEKQEQQSKPQGGAGGSRSKSKGPKADPEGAMRRAMRQACKDASDAASDARDLLNSVQPGLGYAPPVHDQDGSERLLLANALMEQDKFKSILKMVGRLKLSSSKHKSPKTDHGSTSLVGLTRGGDLNRALPTELGLLRHPKLRRLQLAKLADRKLQQYKVAGPAPLGRGPIIVMLDESGSMRSCPEGRSASIAVAIACMTTAYREGRSCFVIPFNSWVKSCHSLDSQGRYWKHRGGGGTDPTQSKPQLIDAKNGASSMALAMASSRARGGTNFNAAFQTALTYNAREVQNKADLVFITDGHAEITMHQQQRIFDLKENTGLKVMGFTVNGGNLSHDVNQVCNEIVDLDTALAKDDLSGVVSALP